MTTSFSLASAKDEPNKIIFSERGHGLLFDGAARKQAGVPDGVAEAIWKMQGQLSKWRQHLHMYPEVGHKEVKTKEFLIKTLTEMGFKPKPLGPTTGVILDIPGANKKFTVGVRADIDALPITEVDDGRKYRSKIDGFMHACGHDAHTTIGLGVAKAVADGIFKPPVNLRLIFQPAEEVGTGAKELIDAGVLKGVDVVLGLHSDPTREWGRIGITPNTWSAYANGFVINIKGRAAHGGASPEQGRDAIVAASHIVSQLQTIVSRNVAPQDAATISVGTLKAGNVPNQIADTAVLAGTMRAQTKEIYDTIVKRANEIAEGTSKSLDMEVEFKVTVELPGTETSGTLFKLFSDVAKTVVGPENVDIYQTANMGAEDFAYFSQERPSLYYWLGIANNKKGINKTLHTPDWDIDERALQVGVALQLAQISRLAKHHASGGKFE